MRNVFIRLFRGFVSVPDAYGIAVVLALIVITVLFVLSITNLAMTRDCAVIHVRSLKDAVLYCTGPRHTHCDIFSHYVIKRVRCETSLKQTADTISGLLHSRIYIPFLTAVFRSNIRSCIPSMIH